MHDANGAMPYHFTIFDGFNKQLQKKQNTTLSCSVKIYKLGETIYDYIKGGIL